jgi:BON domain
MATATATQTEKRTDENIQRDVLAELKWDARLQPNEIGVIVKDGVVTLTGWVDSYTKKWAAEEAAHRVRSVKAVANDIEVRLSSLDERTDADIAAAAVRALEWDAFVPIDKLNVTVSKG